MSRYADPGPLDFDLFWVVFWDILNPALLNPALLNQALLNRALLNRALLNGALLNRRWWGCSCILRYSHQGNRPSTG